MVYDTLSNFIEMEQGSKGFTYSLDGLLIVILQPIEDPVNRFLDPVPDRVEKKDNQKREYDWIEFPYVPTDEGLKNEFPDNRLH
jgi:hypothetical protein